VPLVLHHDYLPGRPVYRRALWAAEALRFHTARRVLAISKHTAEELMQVLHVPASKIDVADLGVDLDRYHVFEGDDRRQIDAARAKYRLEKPYIFYIGAADPRKNVDILIAAFAQARIDGLELVLIGRPRPSDQRAFDRAIEAAGRPVGVRFLGFVPEEDLPAVVAGGVAFVCCSTHEGFPNVHLEAMACGCPVITPGITSMRDTVAADSLVVPPRDTAATSDAIRRIVGEPALRRQLVAAGLRCAARFSLKNTALASVECYARALA
jgi:glycosyltransferase involved in cell wall biosynthesis